MPPSTQQEAEARAAASVKDADSEALPDAGTARRG